MLVYRYFNTVYLGMKEEKIPLQKGYIELILRVIQFPVFV